MDDPATVECQCRAAVAMLERFPWSEDEEAHCLLYVDNYCQHAARFASLLAGADAVPAALAAVDELLHAIASAELRAAGEEGKPNFGHLRAWAVKTIELCRKPTDAEALVQSKQRAALALGLSVDALTRKDEPLGAAFRYFEDPSNDGMLPKLFAAGARFAAESGPGLPDACTSVARLRNKVFMFIEDSFIHAKAEAALRDACYGVITDVSDASVTVYVNPDGAAKGQFREFKTWDGVDRSGEVQAWGAHYDFLDTHAAPVLVSDITDCPILVFED